MKKYLFGLLVISLILAGPIYSQATGSGTDTNTETEEDDQSIITRTEAMEFELKEGQRYVFPEQFRGGDPDHSLVHVLEDVEYERHEHSLVYVGDPGSASNGGTWEDDPNISWTTIKKNQDGTMPDGTDEDSSNVADDNNNKAACTETMQAPGEYCVVNSGARKEDPDDPEETEVGGGDSSSTGTSTSTESVTGTSTSTETTEGNGDGKNGKDKDEKKTRTVLTRQTLGVIVHDCTVPDVWVAFKEGAGNAEIDMYAEGNKLENELFDKMKDTAGEPFSDKASDYEEVSYLFIDEGSVENKERDKEPWNKTVRVTTAGSMFNESNSLEIKDETIDTALVSEETQLRTLPLIYNKDDESKNEKLPCVFVRRNVPFVVAAASIDNGSDRVQSTKNGEGKEIVSRLENEDGTEISKQNGAYMFRVANYPRASYKDQPNYFYVARVEDAEGNETLIKIPLYVINSNASFETSAK